MLKSIFFILSLTLITCYLYINKSETQSKQIENNDDEEQESKNLVNDKELHAAFTKILKNKEVITRTPSSSTVVEPPSQETLKNYESEKDLIITGSTDPEQLVLTSTHFADKFNNDMSDDEKKETVADLNAEIANDRSTLEALKEVGEDEAIKAFEERLNHKENQLKYFSTFVQK